MTYRFSLLYGIFFGWVSLWGGSVHARKDGQDLMFADDVAPSTTHSKDLKRLKYIERAIKLQQDPESVDVYRQKLLPYVKRLLPTFNPDTDVDYMAASVGSTEIHLTDQLEALTPLESDAAIELTRKLLTDATPSGHALAFLNRVLEISPQQRPDIVACAQHFVTQDTPFLFISFVMERLQEFEHGGDHKGTFQKLKDSCAFAQRLRTPVMGYKQVLDIVRHLFYNADYELGSDRFEKTIRDVEKFLQPDWEEEYLCDLLKVFYLGKIHDVLAHELSVVLTKRYALKIMGPRELRYMYVALMGMPTQETRIECARLTNELIAYMDYYYEKELEKSAQYLRVNTRTDEEYQKRLAHARKRLISEIKFDCTYELLEALAAIEPENRTRFVKWVLKLQTGECVDLYKTLDLLKDVQALDKEQQEKQGPQAKEEPQSNELKHCIKLAFRVNNHFFDDNKDILSLVKILLSLERPQRKAFVHALKKRLMAYEYPEGGHFYSPHVPSVIEELCAERDIAYIK